MQRRIGRQGRLGRVKRILERCLGCCRRIILYVRIGIVSGLEHRPQVSCTALDFRVDTSLVGVQAFMSLAKVVVRAIMETMALDKHTDVLIVLGIRNVVSFTGVRCYHILN